MPKRSVTIDIYIGKAWKICTMYLKHCRELHCRGTLDYDIESIKIIQRFRKEENKIIEKNKFKPQQFIDDLNKITLVKK